MTRVRVVEGQLTGASVVSMLEEFERLLAGKNDVKSPGQGQRLRAATPAIARNGERTGHALLLPDYC
jgi:hypothetical protein